MGGGVGIPAPSSPAPVEHRPAGTRTRTRTPRNAHDTHTPAHEATHSVVNQSSVSHTDTRTPPHTPGTPAKWVARVRDGRKLPTAGTSDWNKFVKAWRKWYGNTELLEEYEVGKMHVEANGYHVHEMPKQKRVSINKTEVAQTGIGTAEVELNLVPELA